MSAIYSVSYSFVSVKFNVVKNTTRQHILSDIYTSFRGVSIEDSSHNSGKSNISCLIYFPYCFRKQNHLKNNKYANIFF